MGVAGVIVIVGRVVVVVVIVRGAGLDLGERLGRSLPRTRRDPGAGGVVGLFVVAQAHRVGRQLHAGRKRREQLLLGEDQVDPGVVRELVLIAHGERTRRAGLDAQAAEDAAQ